MSKPDPKTDRRGFLKESAGTVGVLALGGASAAASALGANDAIRLGVVGVGSRGGALLAWANRLRERHNVRVTAVCDLWEKRRWQAIERIKGWRHGPAPASCRTLAELCDRSDVDAVLIATCDFQHCFHAAQAVLAGKDVYVEKPFGCDFAQTRRAHEIISRSDRVAVMGTQQRGSGRYAAAAEFVQSGRLGQVTYVEIAEPIFQQRWRIEGSETSLRPGEIDWNEFLCYLPRDIPFNARQYREFRLFWPFSSGPFCQWMSHRIDAVNLVLGAAPTRAVALGGVYLWKDGRNNPDTVQALLEYPGGVLVSYHLRMGNSYNGRGTTFYGTGGVLELESGMAFGNGGGGAVSAIDVDGPAPRFHLDASRLLRAKKEGGTPLEARPSIDYLGHFFDCVRHRTKPFADVDDGFHHSLACILANQSYRRGCRMEYDPSRRELRPAGEPMTLA